MYACVLHVWAPMLSHRSQRRVITLLLHHTLLFCQNLSQPGANCASACLLIVCFSEAASQQVPIILLLSYNPTPPSSGVTSKASKAMYSFQVGTEGTNPGPCAYATIILSNRVFPWPLLSFLTVDSMWTHAPSSIPSVPLWTASLKLSAKILPSFPDLSQLQEENHSLSAMYSSSYKCKIRTFFQCNRTRIIFPTNTPLWSDWWIFYHHTDMLFQKGSVLWWTQFLDIRWYGSLTIT